MRDSSETAAATARTAVAMRTKLRCPLLAATMLSMLVLPQWSMPSYAFSGGSGTLVVAQTQGDPEQGGGLQAKPQLQQKQQPQPPAQRKQQSA